MNPSDSEYLPLNGLVNAASWILFVLFVFGPFLGYWFMYVDVVSYLRALSRALVVVSGASRYKMPEWARRQDPIYFRELGLKPDCTEEQVKQAYRRLAEQLHPDRGGDPQRFLALRGHLENALEHLAQHHPLSP